MTVQLKIFHVQMTLLASHHPTLMHILESLQYQGTFLAFLKSIAGGLSILVQGEMLYKTGLRHQPPVTQFTFDMLSSWRWFTLSFLTTRTPASTLVVYSFLEVLIAFWTGVSIPKERIQFCNHTVMVVIQVHIQGYTFAIGFGFFSVDDLVVLCITVDHQVEMTFVF